MLKAVALPRAESQDGGWFDRRLNILAYVHLRNIHRSTGAGRVARQLVEHLAGRQDVNLRILADRHDHARVIPLINDPWQTFEYHFFESETSRQQAKWFFSNRPPAEAYWRQADVVFCTAESYVPVKKARLAVTLHDAAYFEEDAHSRNKDVWKQRLKWKLLYRKLAAKADLFHTVSNFSAERLSHFFPSIRSRIRVVYNAVTPHFFGNVTDRGQAYIDSLGLREYPFVLLPGGLHFRKNADLVLKAWPLLKALHPNLVLAVVNHSNEAYLEQARQFGDDFRIVGFAPDEGLHALYAAAQVVWFPSRYEGFGMPILEAMASGSPVLASDSSSLPEVAGGAALLAPPDRPKDHVEMLDGLLRNPRLRNDLSLRGKARAAAFTWKKSAAQLRAHFESLA